MPLYPCPSSPRWIGSCRIYGVTISIILHQVIHIHVYMFLTLIMNIAMPLGTTVDTDVLGRCQPCHFGQLCRNVV